MPFGSVTLIPGVNVERTPTLLQASISQSQLIRFKDSLVQKYGGWQRYFMLNFPGVVRDLHAWQDLNNSKHLLVGSTQQLAMFSPFLGSINITPQTLLTSNATVTSVMNSPIVTVTDPGISNVTIYDSVFFDVPCAIGGLVLQGLYPITTALGGNSYQITASTPATSTDLSGGTAPLFTTTSGSAIVNVMLTNHGVQVGGTALFFANTSANGVSIDGDYTVATVVDVNNFQIQANSLATASGSFLMSGGSILLTYHITIGPAALGAGYGTGTYGGGNYGTGQSTGQQVGNALAATDYTTDNWGEIALACPTGDGVYQFNPTAAFANASIIATAPTFNIGMFVSTAQQILVCFGASVKEYLNSPVGLGVQQDPMLVAWSDSGDFTEFTPMATNQAGVFRIPIGSKIVAGMATPNQDLIWTDLDCWAMNYSGPPFVFGFNKIGAGAAAISLHSQLQLRGNVYWMGPANFYSLAGGAVSVIPCPVWDFVFQNLNQNFVHNIRAMPNTPFNEAGWEFPSSASVSGENDSYVKFNITEPNQPWDFGSLARSAWIDLSILGNPIAAMGGSLFQHETGNNADGQPMASSFTTGYFYIAEGEDFAFVDQIMPDFKWGFFNSPQTAQIQMTFNVVNFPGDTPAVFGPYTVTQSTQYLIVRFRGRQMSITVASNDNGSFWRLGKVRYRYAISGRR